MCGALCRSTICLCVLLPPSNELTSIELTSNEVNSIEDLERGNVEIRTDTHTSACTHIAEEQRRTRNLSQGRCKIVIWPLTFQRSVTPSPRCTHEAQWPGSTSRFLHVVAPTSPQRFSLLVVWNLQPETGRLHTGGAGWWGSGGVGRMLNAVMDDGGDLWGVYNINLSVASVYVFSVLPLTWLLRRSFSTRGSLQLTVAQTERDHTGKLQLQKKKKNRQYDWQIH